MSLFWAFLKSFTTWSLVKWHTAAKTCPFHFYSFALPGCFHWLFRYVPPPWCSLSGWGSDRHCFYLYPVLRAVQILSKQCFVWLKIITRIREACVHKNEWIFRETHKGLWHPPPFFWKIYCAFGKKGNNFLLFYILDFGQIQAQIWRKKLQGFFLDQKCPPPLPPFGVSPKTHIFSCGQRPPLSESYICLLLSIYLVLMGSNLVKTKTVVCIVSSERGSLHYDAQLKGRIQHSVQFRSFTKVAKTSSMQLRATHDGVSSPMSPDVLVLPLANKCAILLLSIPHPLCCAVYSYQTAVFAKVLVRFLGLSEPTRWT